MRLFVLLSHELSQQQIRQAHEVLGVGEILTLPEGLRKTWSSIPPHLESLREYLEPIFSWLSQAAPGDYVLAQGDFGAVFLVVDYAFSRGLVPVYATSERRHREEKAGEEVKIYKTFRHVRFRRYERWEG